MTIELRETTQVRSIWFVGNGRMDILGTVLRQEGEPWRLILRWRHYRDEHAFESEDEKSWWESTAENDSPEEADRLCKSMEALAAKTVERVGGTIDRVDVNGTGADAVDALHAKGWAHSSAKGPPADA